MESSVSSLPEKDPSTHPKVERRGGYDCQFVGKIPQDGQCPECGLLYRSPHQTICCGKRICEGCVERIKKSSKQCPFASCNAAEISSFFDKACVQWLGKYKVNCPNRREGCKWEGQLADLDHHLNLEPTTEKQLKGCLFSRIKCCFCFELFERRFIDNHQSRECLKRPYECEYCEYSATFEEVTQQHSNECPSAPVTCPNNCELVVFQSDLERHRNHDCPLEIQQCEFHAVGCQDKLPRKDMPEHKRQNVAEHSVALSRTLQKAMEDITTLVNEKAETSSMQGAMADITTQQGKMQADITSLKNKAMADITSLRSEKADITSLKKAMADITTQQGKKQAHIVQESSAMQNSLDKMQERVFVQNRTMCLGIVLLSIITVVALAIALLANVSMNGRMSEVQTGFCTSDSCMVEKKSGYKQEQRQRRDELDRKVEEVMVQVKEYATAERQERQQLQEQLSELQYKLDQEIKIRWKAENPNRVQQLNSKSTHRLPFEFEMKDFTNYKKNGI